MNLSPLIIPPQRKLTNCRLWITKNTPPKRNALRVWTRPDSNRRLSLRKNVF